ncbi:cytochrome c oxidase assembly protein subunit 15 [Melghiribacillus thermohalophilus]|uniref:Heme A synthase n=1 Tax=Melghiribacillus thermohalophilus TaxID=1324956 RepID=A0A4R3NHZ8_9BACI|nr:heme A synthase [Melghiribacillus thermohalophilus]TCT26912.1 cytochrome c oxidase assembly protein subunit 15 [Melghiribacillus thermohalophilus]
MIKLLKWLSVASSLGMLLVLVGGALVTKTESGLGCGRSWPLCNGELIPSNITTETIIELSHRVVSGSVGILVLLLSILAWKFYGHIRETKFLAFLSIFFLVFQGLIGAAAVVWGQSDFVLALHFGISLISFAAVFLLMLLIFEIDKKFDARSLIIHKKLRKQFYMLFIYTLIVVYTGALVRHAEASLVCKSWPLCDNSTPLRTDFNLEQWIQVGHRMAAGILLIWVLYLFIQIAREYRQKRIMFFGWLIASILMIAQVLLGAMIIFTILNLNVALLHALVISCFFGLLSYYVLLSNRSVAYEQEMAVEKNDVHTDQKTSRLHPSRS